ncbi:ArsR/SmtB family transcription factor [Micromonospora sp. NPDC051543]|uniref:ArsR/SmtB family transcription factor n=1 Tax=Micromonospora sp. NPDC051543 TaxID=3364287 RepID=UPI0037B56B73
MIRIRFGVEDLSRLTFALPGPYCELAVSAQALQQPSSGFRQLWQAERTGPVPPSARQLLDLVPAHGGIPDFLTPDGAGSLDEALDTVQSTPPARLRAELAALPCATQGASSWVQDLGRGRVAAVEHLGQVIRTYHEHVLAPLWPGIRAAAVHELERRARQLTAEGAAATLNSLHPMIRWRTPVLEVDGPFDADVDLGGQGLRLMPSVWTRPGLALPWRHTTLVYPMAAGGRSHADQPDRRQEALDRLLGPTRANVLRALTTERTTSGLAETLGISVASASGHATALRSTGLAVTRRTGQSVRHRVTPLGRAMLRGREW